MGEKQLIPSELLLLILSLPASSLSIGLGLAIIIDETIKAARGLNSLNIFPIIIGVFLILIGWTIFTLFKSVLFKRSFD